MTDNYADKHAIDIEKRPDSVTFDPRLLVFEYIFDIILRKMQVELVSNFVDHANSAQSMIHQMIMGAGKTNVNFLLVMDIASSPLSCC